jgi:hypothetical protein
MKKKTESSHAARLLVLCARPFPKPRDLSDIRRLLRAGPDWDFLTKRAEEEGVLPLLYWNLRSLADEVSPAVLARLKVSYLRNLARNAQISRQLEPFLRAVRDSGLRVVLTKGLRLASTVYPDLGLRPFWDVDLVVPPADWPALERILAGHGFVETPAGEAGPDRKTSDLGWTYSPYFRRGDLVLEFHFNILGLHFPLRSEKVEVLTSGPIAVGGSEVLVLSPHYELCYLCLHAQQHSYRKLIWLTDIGEMAGRGDMSWDKVFETCRELKISASVHHGLSLVNALWPGTLAPEILSRLRPRPLPRAALGLLWPEAAVAGREPHPAWPYYMPSLFSLWERKSPGLAARTLAAILFPPRPWLARTTGVAPDSLRLYYEYIRRLSRPFGLAVRRLVNSR